MAEMASDHGPAKDALLRATVAVEGAERPALEAALLATLHGRVAPLRDAAEAALQAFCRSNPDGQTMLASTMAPAGDDDSPGAYPLLLPSWPSSLFAQKPQLQSSLPHVTGLLSNQ